MKPASNRIISKAPNVLATARQSGAALLMALLTMALIAVLASSALWLQWRTLSVETAERDAQQAHWLLTGAQDWARVVLREDGRAGNTDHLAEPWATPLREARLSSFLAAAPGGTLTLREGLAEQVFLSGRISDMQSKLNVTNLMMNGQINPVALRRLARLYQVLNLPEAELIGWTKAYEAAFQTSAKLQAPLPPQRLEQLTWLGLSPRSLAKLSPHVTVLPTATPVNLNTASAEVIYASVPGLSLADAQNWVLERNKQAFENLADVRSRVGGVTTLNDQDFSVNTRYFEVMGQLRQNQVSLLQRALVVRDGVETKTVWREARPLLGEPGCLSTIEPPC
jgi:general secretion pathway protein K